MKTFNKILRVIKRQHGTAMLIGGAVIDDLLGSTIKDWDVEIYNMSYDDIINILHHFDVKTDTVGRSFGVIKATIDDVEFDFSIPRLDNRNGTGHKGFYSTFPSNMTPKEAGLRRDLTINSMYKNLHTGEIIDPFGGLDDLHDGVLRATNPHTFIEDPLRVLRIMQLLPRKGKTVHPQTVELCRSMTHMFDDLPKERLMVEFEKLLLKSDKPSMGLRFLLRANWLKHFPELFDLIDCQQNPVWHPEGDVFEHTCFVVDNAAEVRHNIPEDLQLAFMFGALLHDVGKPSTTTADLHAFGHDQAGVSLAETFMRRLTNETKLIDTVKTLVGLHMRPGQLTFNKAGKKAWLKLHTAFRLDVLGWLSRADNMGNDDGDMSDNTHEPSMNCFKRFDDLKNSPQFDTTGATIKPVVMGRDLIAAGMKPGPKFGPILDTAFDLQLDGMDKESIMSVLLHTELVDLL